MEVEKMKIKHPTKDESDKFSCYLCGGDEVYSGIVFKGHCVCEDCVEYVCSSKLTTDGQIIFPSEESTDETLSADAGSFSERSEEKIRQNK